MSTDSLRRLFCPASIAVVGASATPGKAGFEMLRALDDFDGEVFPINPGTKAILGRSVFSAIANVPSTVDLAIVALPAPLCPQAVEEAVTAGVGAVMIISGGFAESGHEGAALEERILNTCQSTGVRLLGPNTSGFANPRIALTANFAPGMDNLTAGPVAIVSQSGAVTLAITAQASDIGLGISLAVGIGNGRDVCPADVIEYLARDKNTGVIVVYLEGVTDGRRLYDAVLNATTAKAVAVYPVGIADIGEFAASHTGNLIGSWEIKRAALEQAGAIVVESIEELIDAAQVFSLQRLEPISNAGIGLLTGQAGPGMIISDYLRSNGASLPTLNEPTVAAIDKLLPPLTYTNNPVDTGRPTENFGKILREVGVDQSIDVLMTFALHEPAAVDPIRLLTDAKKSISKPIVFGTAGNATALKGTLSALGRLGIPAFPTPNRAARAARYLVEDARKSHYRQENSHLESLSKLPDQVLSAVNEHEAKSHLRAIGIPCPEGYLCDTHDQAFNAFERLGAPCVVKVVSPDIAHKTEFAGISLGIDNETALRDALFGIDAIKDVSDIRYLIEVMAPPGLEMILGAKRDASFGSIVLVGLGGTLAEALEDVSIRLAPLKPADAEQMLKELRGRALLDGWRGSTPVDKHSLVKALVALGQFIESQPDIVEIDINPLRVYPDGILALDALIVVDSK